MACWVFLTFSSQANVNFEMAVADEDWGATVVGVESENGSVDVNVHRETAAVMVEWEIVVVDVDK